MNERALVMQTWTFTLRAYRDAGLGRPTLSETLGSHMESQSQTSFVPNPTRPGNFITNSTNTI